VSGFGAHEELQLLAILVSAAALLLLADPLRIPYPILLVVGGLMLGFTPGVPDLVLPPDLVLIGILPPLLYSAAFNTGLRELRRNLRPISFLALGLVAVTAVLVAAVAHYLIGLSWPAGFVLGAVVSPTDPLAATTIARRLGVPRRAVAMPEPVEARSRVLIRAIAALDADFERSMQPDDAARESYAAKRASLKSELAAALAAERR